MARPDERFLGKYKLESSDNNFDAFLKEIGECCCCCSISSSSSSSSSFVYLFKCNLLFCSISTNTGVGLVKRKLANTTYPTLELTKDDQDYLTMVSEEREREIITIIIIKNRQLKKELLLTCLKHFLFSFSSFLLLCFCFAVVGVQVAKAPFRTQTARFRLGEEFDEERMDGKVVKVSRVAVAE